MTTASHTDPVRVFVSYAHEDKRWFDPDDPHNLIPWLTDSLRKQNVVFWFDKRLVGGDVFTRAIQEEIDNAHIAMLIVSQAFLNSTYIENFEMPRIRAREAQKSLAVLPVLVEYCAWEDDDLLRERQMLPGKPTPLVDYIESDRLWSQVRLEMLQGMRRLVGRVRRDHCADVPRTGGSEREPTNALRREIEAVTPQKTPASAQQSMTASEAGREALLLILRPMLSDGGNIGEVLDRPMTAEKVSTDRPDVAEVDHQAFCEGYNALREDIREAIFADAVLEVANVLAGVQDESLRTELVAQLFGIGGASLSKEVVDSLRAQAPAIDRVVGLPVRIRLALFKKHGPSIRANWANLQPIRHVIDALGKTEDM